MEKPVFSVLIIPILLGLLTGAISSHIVTKYINKQQHKKMRILKTSSAILILDDLISNLRGILPYTTRKTVDGNGCKALYSYKSTIESDIQAIDALNLLYDSEYLRTIGFLHTNYYFKNIVPDSPFINQENDKKNEFNCDRLTKVLQGFVDLKEALETEEKDRHDKALDKLVKKELRKSFWHPTPGPRKTLAQAMNESKNSDNNESKA